MICRVTIYYWDLHTTIKNHSQYLLAGSQTPSTTLCWPHYSVLIFLKLGGFTGPLRPQDQVNAEQRFNTVTLSPLASRYPSRQPTWLRLGEAEPHALHTAVGHGSFLKKCVRWFWMCWCPLEPYPESWRDRRPPSWRKDSPGKATCRNCSGQQVRWTELQRLPPRSYSARCPTYISQWQNYSSILQFFSYLWLFWWIM